VSLFRLCVTSWRCLGFLMFGFVVYCLLDPELSERLFHAVSVFLLFMESNNA